MSKKVLIAITRNHAKVWAHGIEPQTKPEIVEEPHVNAEYQTILNKFFNGRNRSSMSAAFAERVLSHIKEADEIYLVGSGKGKASAVGNFVSYLRKQHPTIAEKVRRVETVDLSLLTEPEILDVGRTMFNRSRNV